jgi:hypothetical protein
MQPMEIKALELEQSLLKFLAGVIADYGLYIFMGLVFLLIPFLAWVLSGGLRRKLLKGKPVVHVTPVIGVQIPIGRPTPPPEPFDPFPPSQDPPDCDDDDH